MKIQGHSWLQTEFKKPEICETPFRRRWRSGSDSTDNLLKINKTQKQCLCGSRGPLLHQILLRRAGVSDIKLRGSQLWGRR